MDAERAADLATSVAYLVLAFASLRVHLRQQSEASRWLLLTFATIGTAVALEDVAAVLGMGDARLLSTISGMLVLAFPYALFRFGTSFQAAASWLRRAAGAAAVAVIVALPVLSAVPQEPDELPAAYLLVVALYWTALSALVVVRLWRSSDGQPSVARRRLRVLAVGAGVLNVALLLAVAAPEGATWAVSTQLLALASAVAFLLGFAPPGFVRRSWRASDEAALRSAERGLLSAEDVRTVARELVPALTDLFGGEAALVDVHGRSLGNPADPPLVGLPRPEPGGVEATPDSLVLGLQRGLLVVRANTYTPFFGAEEVGLLRAFAASLDLALSRVSLLERERHAREQAEATNAELEALLYGISHDLRTPLVALTGYIELLSDDRAEAADGGFVLDRMTANTAYMDALITDLLDLSRIGRTRESTAVVDLTALARELGEELTLTHPGAHVRVEELPLVDMEPARARQLLTNLIANALRHAGRDDVTVRITALTDDSGATVSVADDGVGIAPEHRQRVFGIFERLQGREAQGAGTGIGLAMCRKIVEQLGGEVWIADATVGTDLRFRIPADRIRKRRRSLEASS